MPPAAPVAASPTPLKPAPRRSPPLIGRGLQTALTAGLVGLVIGFVTSWPFIRFSQLNWAETVVLLTTSAVPWFAFALLVLALAHWFPIDPESWRRALPFHLAASLALAAGLDILSSTMAREMWSRQPPFFLGRWSSGSGPAGTASAPRSWPVPRSFSFPAPVAASPAAAPGTDHPPTATATPPRPWPRRDGSERSDWPARGTAEPSLFHRGSLGPGGRNELPSNPFRFGAADDSPHFLLLAMMSLRAGILFVIYTVLLAATQAIRNHRRALLQAEHTSQARALLVEARLQALQTQIQPHFLFNTLNAVTEFIHDQPAVAEEMLCALSSLLRHVLTLADRHEMPLADELGLVDLYLSIQHHRFADRLQFEREIEPGLETAAVPPLLLQPLIENAVVHGIGRRREPSRVRLQILRIHDQLRLSLTEQAAGAGAAASTASPSPPSHGIGLENTRARLQTLYGDRASLHSGPQANGVYYTEVNIPLHFVSPAPCEP